MLLYWRSIASTGQKRVALDSEGCRRPDFGDDMSRSEENMKKEKNVVLYLDGFKVKRYVIHGTGWATVETVDGSQSLIRPARVLAMLKGQQDTNERYDI